MRFVPVKSAERQSVMVLHRTRALLVRQRTMLINAIRGHCAEFGVIVAQGLAAWLNSWTMCVGTRARRFPTWPGPPC
jgi:transposase